MQAFLDTLKEAGKPFPVRPGPKGWAPDYTSIATATSVAAGTLKIPTTNAGRLLAQAFAAWLEATDMPVPPPETATADRIARREQARTWKGSLLAYASTVRAAGGKLPRNPKNPNAVDLRRVAALCDVPSGWLSNPGSAAAPIMKALTKELGIEGVRMRDPEGSDRSYGALRAFGANLREAELAKAARAAGFEVRASDRQAVQNALWALAEFRRFHKKEDDAEIGPELAADYKTAVDQVIDGNPHWKRGTIAKHRTEMKRWVLYARKMTIADGLPDDGFEALKYLMDQNRTPFSTLAIGVGMTASDRFNLQRWLRGERGPDGHQLELFERIEDFFQVPVGTLSSRVAFFMRSERPSPNLFPDAIPVHWRATIRRYLPSDYMQKDEAERTQIARNIWALANSTNIDYRKEQRDLTRRQYTLGYQNGTFRTKDHHEGGAGQFLSQLSEEWHRWAEFKTAELSPIDEETGAILKRGKRWRAGTAERTRIQIERIFGAAMLPVDKGGLGLPATHATLALFAIPRFTRWFKEWGDARRGGVPSNSETIMLGLVVELLSPHQGWLLQQWDMMSHLRSFDALCCADQKPLLPAHVLANATADWRGWCERFQLAQRARLAELDKTPHPRRRKPFAPIQPLLSSENPLEQVAALGDRIRAQMPDRRYQPTFWAYELRASLIIDLLCETRLRARNLAEISIVEGTKNLLHRHDGNFRITIHGSEFKNSDNGMFWHDGAQISVHWNIDPALTPWIELYLKYARPILLKGVKSDRFFISKPRQDTKEDHGGMKPNQIGVAVREISKMLAYNPITGDGIWGVETFGSHAIRDLAATHVLRQNGTFEQAAAVLADSVAVTKRHYADFTSSDVIDKVQHFIRSARPAMRAPVDFL